MNKTWTGQMESSVAKPAHKQDDPAKYPGQIKNEITLDDYYTRKGYVSSDSMEVKKKLSFEEWYRQNRVRLSHLPRLKDGGRNYAIEIWNAAQENK
jgi:hypothetical protein